MRVSAVIYLGLCLGALGLVAASIPPPDDIVRPKEDWVSAGPLDDHPRALTIALSPDLWVAYDLAKCAYFKAWQGGNGRQVSRQSVFESQPVAEGLLYYLERSTDIWQLSAPGFLSTSHPEFVGHTVFDNQLTLSYRFYLPDGTAVSVRESPEVVYHADGRPGLERKFFVDRLPEGAQLRLRLSHETMKQRNDIRTNGIFQREAGRKQDFAWGRIHDVTGWLLLEAGKEIVVTTYFAPGVLRQFTQNEVLDPAALFKHNPLMQHEEVSRLERNPLHDPGVSLRVYDIGHPMDQLYSLVPGQLPNVFRNHPQVNLTEPADFGDHRFYFISLIDGFLNLPTPGHYQFRLLADDGFRLSIRNELVLEHNGLHATKPTEIGEVELPAGVHPFRIEHFQSTGPTMLRFEWRPPWETVFRPIPPNIFSTTREDRHNVSTGRKRLFEGELGTVSMPDGAARLEGLHPSISIEKFSLEGLDQPIGGMGFLADGRLVVATWEASGDLMLVDGLTDELGTPEVQKVIARGLSEPMGMTVVDGAIFVLQREGLIQLNDLDADERMDEYRIVGDGWNLSTELVELSNGLVYDQGRFIGTLGVPIGEDGATLIEPLPERGTLIQMGFDGAFSILSNGLHLPTGISLDRAGILWISDYQSPWLASSRLVRFVEDENGSRHLNVAAWLPDVDGIAMPGQPFQMEDGPYEGQLLLGDMASGALYRVALDTNSGAGQGGVFPLGYMEEGSAHRIANRDGAYILGSARFEGEWGRFGQNAGGLYRLKLESADVFEMTAIHATVSGFEIQFSEPWIGDEDLASLVNIYTRSPSGPMQGEFYRSAPIKSARLTEDREALLIEMEQLEAGLLYYFVVDQQVQSTLGKTLWSNEAWYSMVQMPGNIVGIN